MLVAPASDRFFTAAAEHSGMVYDELADRLGETSPTLTVSAFPNGSIDTYYHVVNGDDGTVVSREAFAEDVVLADRDSIRLDRELTAVGGQTVNMARQAHAFENDVTLVGHLDDPMFDALDFETASMGDPAWVTVLLFRKRDLMLAEESADIRNWDLADLRDAAPRGLTALLSADLVCAGNWGSFPGLGDALSRAGSIIDDGGVFVFDPGTLAGNSPESLRSMLAALSDLARAFTVVLSTNEPETNAIANAIEGTDEGEPLTDQLAAIREHAALDGTVLHEEVHAIAATEDGARTVPNLDTSRIATVTGAGDRFTAGLGQALALGWGWDLALALGNACASYHVVHGETGTPAVLRTYVQRHEPTAR